MAEKGTDSEPHGAAVPLPPGIPHRDFLERALVAAGEWTRYADPKALGVLVVLGLGIKDLLDHAHRFFDKTTPTTADVAFVIACAAAVAVVGFVTHALFSRMTLQGLLAMEDEDSRPRSRFFFAEVGRYGSQEAYAQDVLAKKEHDLLRDMAGQVYEVSRVCVRKHGATQRAYVLAIAFLLAWAVARIALSTVS